MRTKFNCGEYKVEKYLNGKDVSLFGAFPEGAELTFRVSVPRRFASLDATLYLFSDNGDEGHFPLKWISLENSCDVYEGVVKKEQRGLYFYKIVFRIKWGERSVPNYRDGGDVFQLTFHAADFESPKWLNGSIMYQVFPDRFCNGKALPVRDDAVLNEDWYDGIPQFAEKPGDPVANNMFFGGDLYGVAEKMEYIASLGVNVLYLNPIFEAYSNHKYDIGDYMKVDSMFGGEDGLEEVLVAARKNGIRVILDGVFNHTGDDSKYFNRYGKYNTLGAYQSKKSEYCDWYNFTNHPDEFESWWGIKIMPSTNKNNPKFREYINGENGVVRHYLEKGTSGWRLDVADELPDDFLAELTSAAKKEKSDAVVIGEVWEDASNKIAYDKRRRYFVDGELDSVMNYPFRDAIISYVRDGNAENIAAVTSRIYEHYPKSVCDNLMNIIGTHDTERILTVLGGKPCGDRTNEQLSTATMTSDERKTGISRVKLAYLLSATLPGFPCIYYGDEVGMEGYRDPFNRRPFPWGKEDVDLLDWYKKIGELRRTRREFTDGIYEVLWAERGVFAFRRDDVLVLFNMRSSGITYDPSVLIGKKGVYKDLLTSRTFTEFGKLEPESCAVITLEQ